MSYLGRGVDKISNIETLDNITFNGASSYTLQKGGVNFVPSSASAILISIDGVVQSGNFTVSSSTIDFGTAIAGTSTCNFIIHLGTGVLTTPSDGSVSTAKIADDAVTEAKLNLISTSSVPSLEAKGDGSSQDGYIQLNCSQNSHGVKIKSPPHSAGQSYTLTLPSSINNDQFLKTDGSGNLSFAEAGGGKVNQVVTSTTSYNQSTTGSSAIDIESSSGTAWETAITPSASSSKILLIVSICIYNLQNSNNTQQENRYFLKTNQKIGSGSYSEILGQNWIGHYYYNGTQKAVLDPAWRSFTKLQSPNTTDEVKYKFTYGLQSANGSKVGLNNDGKISSITLIEVLA